MDMNEYQKKAKVTADYPTIGKRYIYPLLGLTGEAGEVSEKIKKLFRDHNGVLDEDYKKKILLELGDVLWYLTIIADELGSSLEEVAEMNINKLSDRLKRNKIHGDGDFR